MEIFLTCTALFSLKVVKYFLVACLLGSSVAIAVRIHLLLIYASHDNM